MTVIRWILHDPRGPESYTMHINPNQASSPRKVKQLSHGIRLDGAATTFQAPPAPQEWSFGGVIRTKEHHDELLRWSRKKGPLRVTDHLGQTFEIMIRDFETAERRKTALTPWRLTYTMQTLVLRRIA